MERRYGSLSFRVPDTIDADKAKASFEKGVLKVTIPKRAEAVKAENANGLILPICRELKKCGGFSL